VIVLIYTVFINQTVNPKLNERKVMCKQRPSSRYENLLSKLISDIDSINNDTPWQDYEPEWWLQMMVLRKSAVERKNRLPNLSNPEKSEKKG
tara:strand:+ start:55 stop:330 length:276 start_codon:yes stop_codon:yes gene_type:complete